MPNPRPFEKYVPFTSDYGFKVTFGNEHNTLFLRRAIQAITGLKQPVLEVIFEKNTKEAPSVDGRHMVYDLTLRLDNGEIAIVEMQLSEFPYMIKRLEYYAMARMAPFVKKGKWQFKGIPRIYAIGIMQHRLFDDDDFYRVTCLYDQKHRIIDDTLQFIIIELDKFDKTPETCTTDLDKLIYTMKSSPAIKENEDMPTFMEDEWLASALEELESGKLSPDEKANLEVAIAHEMFNRSAERLMFEEKWEKGLKAGMEQGMEQGIKEGIKKGIKEGIKEGKQIGKQIGIKQGKQIGITEGTDAALKTSINRILQKHPDWTDVYISDLLEVPLDLVVSVRDSLLKNNL